MISIVDYGLGNLLSVSKALEEVAGKRKVVVSRNPDHLEEATHIILPGVGNFRAGIQNIRSYELLEPLTRQVLYEKKPFLGICLGMQLLAEFGEEEGECKGMGWIPGRVRLLEAGKLKIPHIGWNDLVIIDSDFLFEGITGNTEFYFVHSYYFDCSEEHIIAKCNYGKSFAAAIRNDNIFATQFHPEKSRASGLKLLYNFLHKSC